MRLIVQFGNFSSRLHTKNAEDQDMQNKAFKGNFESKKS
jgi:hypothetical protein